MPDIIVIAQNIRSTHNVGALFRTADGFGVSKIILSGYTPYPKQQPDPRLPHIAEKLHAQIHKTALGAESTVPFEYHETLDLQSIKDQGYTLIALEQNEQSTLLQHYTSPAKVALLLGEEVHGITNEHLEQCDAVIEIPMQGKKESFNVSVAAGIALYALSVQ